MTVFRSVVCGLIQKFGYAPVTSAVLQLESLQSAVVSMRLLLQAGSSDVNGGRVSV